MPAQPPQMPSPKAPLIWAKVGVLRRVRENVVKSGHVVGLGSSLVLNPSRESRPIGYVDNLAVTWAVSRVKLAVLLTARGGSVF